MIVDQRMGPRMRRLSRWCGAAVAGAVALGGCSSPGSSLESAPETRLAAVRVPLHDPVWSHRMHTLIAPTDDHRLAEIAPYR